MTTPKPDKDRFIEMTRDLDRDEDPANRRDP